MEYVTVSAGTGHAVLGALLGGVSATVLELEVPGLALWWPRGHGDQPLYPLRVELTDAAGNVLDTRERRIAQFGQACDTRNAAEGAGASPPGSPG
ncbi:hypothetical protein Misp01_34390 [Microtetraspora sp. NBRC 13810]|uniref:hypothetical protein n=1 Tax=Microtetraspora sp. NBRC 13810 TaxID=3030990 RepID=UPI0024A5A9F1|nr:hypothetical protein Misp01_34390 [Microtetraspora sp. NBRC 13810]